MEGYVGISNDETERVVEVAIPRAGQVSFRIAPMTWGYLGYLFATSFSSALGSSLGSELGQGIASNFLEALGRARADSAGDLKKFLKGLAEQFAVVVREAIATDALRSAEARLEACIKNFEDYVRDPGKSQRDELIYQKSVCREVLQELQSLGVPALPALVTGYGLVCTVFHEIYALDTTSLGALANLRSALAESRAVLAQTSESVRLLYQSRMTPVTIGTASILVDTDIKTESGTSSVPLPHSVTALTFSVEERQFGYPIATISGQHPHRVQIMYSAEQVNEVRKRIDEERSRQGVLLQRRFVRDVGDEVVAVTSRQRDLLLSLPT